ncbi:glycosyltransferase family 2 protein [Paraburkholderia sp. RP-4-7]|jgi:rhamnosyltransferase|uniref:Glycosyltransferase family 2 protein n=1 Tax=Paraburkholderia polaris TaxID=2728848 RepID=A0A848I632_9BURK|nr:glycosyltransferase family 2 protein [Paraburkholderia polaris]
MGVEVVDSINGAAKVACIVPTYNGREDLIRLTQSLKSQSQKFDFIVVDSSSRDGTAEVAAAHGATVFSIPTAEFNHGATRQRMIDNNPGYDFYVFLTQDAYLEDQYALENIIRPFANKEVGAVCGRQLPHLDASVLSMHARKFNYPDTSEVKSLKTADKSGMKAAFMSNSFSAYRGEAIKAVGGFPAHVILSEDMYVAAKMLLKGWKIAYEGSARCRHSHNYTLLQEFKRYFDIGVFHAREEWIRKEVGGAGKEGLRYVINELKFLGMKKIHLWPISIVRNGLKLIAFRISRFEKYMSPSIKRRLSMHHRYWDDRFAR